MRANDLYADFKNGKLLQVYSDLYPALIAYAVRYLGDDYAFLAEDCVQESIFNAYLSKNRIPDEASLKSFIYTAVRNRAISFLRKGKSQRNYVRQLEYSERDIAASLIEQETMRRLFVAIDSLPESYRKVFDMSFEDGLKNKEIASRLGISESAVKKRKARMIEHLRKSVTESGDTSQLVVLLLIANRLLQ